MTRLFLSKFKLKTRLFGSDKGQMPMLFCRIIPWCQTPEGLVSGTSRAGVRLQLGGCQIAVEHTCNYGTDRNCRITIPGVTLLSQTWRFRRRGDTENYQKLRVSFSPVSPCLALQASCSGRYRRGVTVTDFLASRNSSMQIRTANSAQNNVEFLQILELPIFYEILSNNNTQLARRMR